MKLFRHIWLMAVLGIGTAAFGQEPGAEAQEVSPEVHHETAEPAEYPPAVGTEKAADHIGTAATLYDEPVQRPHDPIIENIRRAYGDGFPDPLDPDTLPPATPGDESLTRQSLQAAAILLLICGLIIFSAYLARRFGQRTPLLAGPNLGKELGRVYLNPKATLHYVQSGDRVLVVGVTPTAMSLITEFDATTFNGQAAPAPRPLRPFQDQLRSADARLSKTDQSVDDEEIDALRGDIKRLQQYLQDSAREHT